MQEKGRKRDGTRRMAGVSALIAVLLVGAVSASFAADCVIIANKKVPTGALSKADVQSMFLGEKGKWDDGKSVKLAVLESGGGHASIAGKTPAQFENTWKRLIFTGKAAAPKSFEDESSLIGYVASTPGAIACVSHADSSVKVISVK